MLDSFRQGYAVMDINLSGISFESEYYEDCKRWCKNGDIIAERIPKQNGFRLYLFFGKPYKPVNLKSKSIKNIFWMHWSIFKAYTHRTGDIVYRSGE